MLKTLYSYFGDARRLSQAAFVEKFGGAPWLLVDAFDQLAEAARVATVAGGSVVPGERALGPVRKREGANAFVSMVTLGRAANNDLAIPAPDVSGFHAYFSPTPDGCALLTDASSTYGTTVDGVRLEPNLGTLVRPGQALGFASVRARLLDAASVYELLQT